MSKFLFLTLGVYLVQNRPNKITNTQYILVQDGEKKFNKMAL